ncbi:acyltransferase family protein [Patescibacteria group bacterium]|nr:acyltransferase family protein [Patescibacteria group bacterium]
MNNKITNKKKRVIKRILWPDAIRVISVFLVILIHTSAKVVLSWGQVNTSEWIIGNIFDSFARIAVPLFVLLSGSLLLHKKDNLKTFLKKRTSRILFPWLFWGTILLFLNNFSVFGNKSLKLLLIENFLSGFWFMPMITGIYIITPIIKKFVVNATKKELKYFFGIWFVLASLVPTLNNIFDLDISFINPSWFAYLGYFVGGYYIVHKSKISKQHLRQSKLIFIICLMLTIFGTYLLSNKNNQFSGYLYEYLSVNVLLMSFSSFILLFNYFKKVKINYKLTKYINFISKNSFGILLSHIIIIKIFSLQPYPLITIPLSTIVIFSFTLFLISGLKKVSFLKNVVG